MVTSIRTGASGEKAYGVRYVHEAVKVNMGSVEVFEVSGELQEAEGILTSGRTFDVRRGLRAAS